jgi:hypothetical protein
MEWQAGFACGALLMPQTYLRTVVADLMADDSLYRGVPLRSAAGQAVLTTVAQRFHVSRGAAYVRLRQSRFLVPDNRGLRLFPQPVA